MCDGRVEWVDVWNLTSTGVHKIRGPGVPRPGYYRTYRTLAERRVDEIYGGYKHNCGESDHRKLQVAYEGPMAGAHSFAGHGIEICGATFNDGKLKESVSDTKFLIGSVLIYRLSSCVASG